MGTVLWARSFVDFERISMFVCSAFGKSLVVRAGVCVHVHKRPWKCVDMTIIEYNENLLRIPVFHPVNINPNWLRSNSHRYMDVQVRWKATHCRHCIENYPSHPLECRRTWSYLLRCTHTHRYLKLGLPQRWGDCTWTARQSLAFRTHAGVIGFRLGSRWHYLL